jgi:hypothetical protein
MYWGLGMGYGAGIGTEGQCINYFVELEVDDEGCSYSYVTNNDCSSTFTEIYINGTSYIYETAADTTMTTEVR